MRSMHLQLVVIFSTLFTLNSLGEQVVLGTQSYSSPHIGAAINTMQNGANYFNTQALQSMLSSMQSDQEHDEHGHGKGGKGKGKGKGKKGCGDKGKKQAQQAAVLQFMVESLQKADCLAKGGTVLPGGGCGSVPPTNLPPGTVIAIPKAAMGGYPGMPMQGYPGMPVQGYPGAPYPGAMPIQPYPGTASNVGYPSSQLVNLNGPLY